MVYYLILVFLFLRGGFADSVVSVKDIHCLFRVHSMPFSGRKWFFIALVVPGYLTRGAAEGAMAWPASKQI